MYERLLKLMKENNITAYRLSQETGVTQATLSRWKSGKTSPSIETLQALADYFHVSLDYLIGNVSEPFFYLDNEKILQEINSYGDEPEQEAKRPAENEEGLVVLGKEANPDIVMIARAGGKMTKDQAENLRKYAQYMFPEAFEDNDNQK